MNLPSFLSRIFGVQPAATPVPVPQPTVKVNTMTLVEAKTFLEAHLATAEADIKAKWAEVIVWAEAKVVKDAAFIAAEIADLTAKGYLVTPPSA
jgi:hypothetical protein